MSRTGNSQPLLMGKGKGEFNHELLKVVHGIHRDSDEVDQHNMENPLGKGGS